MKTQLNNRSGFTLIEIIVVLIIVGILAAIALPNLFSNVEKSRSAEALTSMGTYKSDIEGCLQAHVATATTSCGSLADTGISSSTSTNFIYNYTAPATDVTSATWAIEAVYGGNSTDTITMTRNSDGSITCAGAPGTAFAGVC